MRKMFSTFLTVFFCGFIVFSSNAQSDTAIKFVAIVTKDSAKKSDLFNKARSWVNETFKNINSVIKISDPESGELSGKGIFIVDAKTTATRKKTAPCYISFSFSIYCKDGKYKIIFGPFENTRSENNIGRVGVITSAEIVDKPGFGITKKQYNAYWSSVKEETILKAQTLLTELQNKMNAKAESEF